MLTFTLKEFHPLLRDCLEVFEKNLIITSLLHSMRELIETGKAEYCRDGKCQPLFHNSLGIRSLASLIRTAMILHLFEGGIEPKIMNVMPSPNSANPINNDPDKLSLAWGEKYRSIVVRWCKLFNIPVSPSIDLNQLYYTNHN